MEEEIRYSLLAYRDESGGIWLKISEAPEIQLRTEDISVGMELLDEHIESLTLRARTRGQEIPFTRSRIIRWVGKEEYGPTQLDIERERYLRELSEEV